MHGSPYDADTPDGRSATSKAAEWASRIMTISLEMVLPGLAGYWLDGQAGTLPLFMLVGFGLGGYLAFLQLRAIARTTKNHQVKKSPQTH